ncbi:hypothetical protein KKE92_04770 [Candidatus Micrarchaeota archaeon]|nr:hypothetical protein [Candidatus Micrarchaeota archaeon]
MVTFKGPKPAMQRREVPEGKARAIVETAKHLSDYWGSFKPSSYELAPDVVYDTSMFFSLENPSPVLGEALKGRRLIDIGAGNSNSFLSMAHLAATLGVSEYVAVDRYVDYTNAEEVMEKMINPKFPDILLRAINEDMLQFLFFQPDQSANVCMNSVDRSILASNVRLATDIYMSDIAQELMRVVPSHGVAFGLNAPALDMLPDFGFTRITEGLFKKEW